MRTTAFRVETNQKTDVRIRGFFSHSTSSKGENNDNADFCGHHYINRDYSWHAGTVCPT